ncbi:16416_t:CDS:2 [Funneliformis mosseae]|uniref:16416_t:CDS:1 n=1 Tax=Funneliformis mosseae TaxID=27381 RepID=A0A9N9C9F5_FUNMO|nr:16416_t:CDS:2 [Funneliformis mosseae]
MTSNYLILEVTYSYNIANFRYTGIARAIESKEIKVAHHS